jgi:hypothetical protein
VTAVIEQTVIVRGRNVPIIVAGDALPQVLESLEESIATWDTTQEALTCDACRAATRGRCGWHLACQAKSDGFRVLLKSLTGDPAAGEGRAVT